MVDHNNYDVGLEIWSKLPYWGDEGKEYFLHLGTPCLNITQDPTCVINRLIDSSFFSSKDQLMTVGEIAKYMYKVSLVLDLDNKGATQCTSWAPWMQLGILPSG